MKKRGPMLKKGDVFMIDGMWYTATSDADHTPPCRWAIKVEFGEGHEVGTEVGFMTEYPIHPDTYREDSE